MTNTKFNFDEAFSRNLGFVTPEELAIIKNKRIAIAGLGGVGGIYLITLMRMGFQKFNLADFDSYELTNFNRQYGANINTIGKSKLEVMIEKAREINPEVEVCGFADGVTDENINSFLEGVDFYVDGLDLFVLKLREKIFAKCSEAGIPATTVAPIGMGAALVNFLPGRMSFAEYFGFNNDDFENVIKFLVGLSPKFLHLKSLVAPEYADIEKQKSSSTPMGVSLAAGVAVTEVIKILLKRGPVSCAPTSIHFDAYQNKIARSYTWRGSKNPLVKVLILFLKTFLRRKQKQKTAYRLKNLKESVSN